MNDENKFGEEAHAEQIEPAAQESAEQTAMPEPEPETKSLPDILYGVLTKPVETLRYIATAKPLAVALIIFAVIAVLNAIATTPATNELTNLQLGNLPGRGGGAQPFSGPLLTTGTILFAPVFGIIWLLIISGIYQLLARAFKGKGEFRGLVSAIAFANFPQVFTLPFALLPLVLGLAGAAIYWLASLVVATWVIVLVVVAIRENYSLSTGEAIAVYLIPLNALLIIIGAFIILAVVLLVGVIGASTGAGGF